MTSAVADVVFMIVGLMFATCLGTGCAWLLCMYRPRQQPPPLKPPPPPPARKFYVVDHPGGECALAV